MTGQPARETSWRRLRAGWLVCWLFAVVLSVSVAGAVFAQGISSVNSVKAAYVYKFLAYVEWPSWALPDDSHLVIGVAGADAVASELQTLIVGRHVDGHPIEARVLGEGDSVEGLHAVFVGRPAAVPAWVERLRGKPVLVVTDLPAGLNLGSMLNLVSAGGRIRFEASTLAADRAGIRLSARLLALADRVVKP